MSLKDIANLINGEGENERKIESAEDAFDSPMMIMNQIHEA